MRQFYVWVHDGDEDETDTCMSSWFQAIDREQGAAGRGQAKDKEQGKKRKRKSSSSSRTSTKPSSDSESSVSEDSFNTWHVACMQEKKKKKKKGKKSEKKDRKGGKGKKKNKRKVKKKKSSDSSGSTEEKKETAKQKEKREERECLKAEKKAVRDALRKVIGSASKAICFLPLCFRKVLSAVSNCIAKATLAENKSSTMCGNLWAMFCILY